MSEARSFFTPDDLSNIRQAIRAAEMKTSGEIRVHIEEVCPKAPVLDRAAEVFADLKMHQTAQRNGVLFYLAVQDRQFAILGDEISFA